MKVYEKPVIEVIIINNADSITLSSQPQAVKDNLQKTGIDTIGQLW